MFARVQGRLSYANVVATIALFVALGGGAYAAVKLPANSVGTRQVKQGAIRSADVKDASLLSRDFRPGALPAGPTGATGSPGAQGPAGPQGPAGAGCPAADPACRGPAGAPGTNGTSAAANIVVRTAGPSAVPGFLIARCNSGEKATGGGGSGGPISESVPYTSDSHAGDQPAFAHNTPTAWGVTVTSGSPSSWVVCASP